MSFRLKPGAPLPREVRRLMDRQLAAAIECLETAKPPGPNNVHKARTHVKKARALLRLVRSALGDRYAPANRRLRTANRLLGPIADANAVLGTFDRLRDLEGSRLAAPTVSAIRADLLAQLERINQRAESGRVRARAVRLLQMQQRRASELKLKTRGKAAVVAAVKAAQRDGREARDEALAYPRPDALHTWRRRVKNQWYLLRLLARSCGGRLIDDQHRLEGLDACLGELHNVDLLAALILEAPSVSRRETAQCLLAVRAYRRDLLRKARILGRFFDETPGAYAERVRVLWNASPALVDAPRKDGPWLRVA